MKNIYLMKCIYGKYSNKFKLYLKDAFENILKNHQQQQITKVIDKNYIFWMTVFQNIVIYLSADVLAKDLSMFLRSFIIFI